MINDKPTTVKQRKEDKNQLKEKNQRKEEKTATDARRKATRDKWDEDTDSIKQVLLAETKPLLTESQKLTLNHVKTSLLENGRGFLCPAVKKTQSSKSGSVLSQTSLSRLVFCVPLSVLCNLSPQFSPA